MSGNDSDDDDVTVIENFLDNNKNIQGDKQSGDDRDQVTSADSESED